MPNPLAIPSPELIARLGTIVGPAHALGADDERQAAYLVEPRGKYRGRTPLVLRPGSTAEVAAIAAACNEARVALVPQSGNTGLVGGQTPGEDGAEIVLSLGRLRQIRGVDQARTSMIVEAGLTLAEVRAAAEREGRLFPLSMASEGSCQIGGNLATNAGGVGVLAHGNARQQVLGLEVVLADGRVWDGLRTLKKDNTGYDLRDLFIGCEGTLGIITAAALKLVPRPAEVATAFAALSRLEDVLALFQHAEAMAGGALTAFEFLPRFGIEVVTQHVPGARDPFPDPHPWYVLLDISGSTADGTAERTALTLMAEAAAAGIVADATVADSLARARALWRLREAMSEAQKHAGGSIKHDISVPVPLLPAFIAGAGCVVERVCPGARPMPFGHFGDGNVHYNVSQPRDMDTARFLALWQPMQDAVHGLVVEMGGSISAEHGIGRMKRDELARVKSAVELDLMRSLKAALDPNGILNPGRVL
jgi:FAD/FMN-containing dehydrogenase